MVPTLVAMAALYNSTTGPRSGVATTSMYSTSDGNKGYGARGNTAPYSDHNSILKMELLLAHPQLRSCWAGSPAVAPRRMRGASARRGD